MPSFNKSEDKRKERREKVESERQWKEQAERDRARRRTTTAAVAETPKPLSHKEKRLKNRLEASMAAASNEESTETDLSKSASSNDTCQMQVDKISRKNSAQDDDCIDELADAEMENDNDSYSFFKKKQPALKEKNSPLSGNKQPRNQEKPKL